MLFRQEDYQKAVEYWKDQPFPSVTREQLERIREAGNGLIKFHLRHPAIHHFISFCVFAILFSLDWLVIVRLGRNFQSPVLCGIVIGLLHGALMYSLAIYTLHEGAAHKLIVLRGGKLSRFFSLLANNANRIVLSESDYYAKSHLSHHAHFTTPQDEEFLNYVAAKRFFSAFIPFAAVLNFTDFKAHTGNRFTSSRMLSLALTFAYHAVIALVMLQYYSWLTIVVALVVVFPNFAFWLDRLRQYTEHNLMPLSTIDGARDLGNGFWGMLIGGGPWGQPCHWTHHLMPGIPWYNQLRLHRVVKKTFSPQQRQLFFLSPVVGFPFTLLRIIRSTSKD